MEKLILIFLCLAAESAFSYTLELKPVEKEGFTFLGYINGSSSKSDEISLRALYLSNNALSWTNAYLACESGKLVSLENVAKDTEVNEHLQRVGLVNIPIWTSGRYDSTKAMYVWQKKSPIPVTYANWLPAHPQNRNNYCVYVTGDLFSYGWGTVSCPNVYRYICEV